MPTYDQALLELNPAQRKAVETIDGPVLVIAGPGTGKTQLLTTRIAHILATTDTLPQNILCLTFTDSAAQTMRERLSNLIGQGAYDVTISTYHAFGSDLIRRYPDYFAEEADLQPVDELGIDRILRGIVAKLPFSNPLKYSDAYLVDIKALISEAKRALLTPSDLRKVATDNLQFIEATSKIVTDSLGGLARIDKKAIVLFETLLSRAASHESNSLNQLFWQSLRQAVEEATSSGKTTPLTAWKNQWLAKDKDGRFIVDGTKANQKLLAAADVYEAYLAELQARELFDYDDMILRAVRALETNKDLRYTLQEQYQYLLLDEFQDTNEAQLRIVQLLTDNPVNEGRPNVLAVGDDDQAIYAFQGANYSHMLQFNELYRDVVVVPLTENYRSHPDILHTARGIAEQIEERLHHHFAGIQKDITASAKDLPTRAVVERREAQSDVMQFSWVTKQIQKLLADGVPPEEIAVLAPKHKYLEPLVPFLTEQTIPVRYEKRENVLDDPAINQLLRMSELVLALGSGEQGRANALWAQVLSFGFWELPTSLIWRLSWQATDDDRNWTDELLDDPKLKPIALFFIRLSHLAGTENLETMLDYLIGSTALDLQEPGFEPFTSQYYQHYFGTIDPETKADFWSLLTNLVVLRARLREYRRDGEERLLLADFIEFVEAHQAAELKIQSTSPYASATNAVQLMTAYKAKGMEFTAVFLLAVNDEAWGGKARTQSTRISLPPNLQYIRYAGATEDERLRLLYVAITRAKSQLYLVGYSQNYAGKLMTRLKYLNESADNDTVRSPLLPAANQLVLPAEDGVPTPTTELAAYWQQRHETALSSADMRALLNDRLQNFQLSPTHLCDFIDLAHSGPQAFFLHTVLRFPQAPSPAVQYGNTIHETLEQLCHLAKQNNAMPGLKTMLAVFTRKLQAKKLSAQDYEQYLVRGQEALAAYLAQSDDLSQLEVACEYNFRNEGVFAGKAHLSGKIDKLIIDKTRKEITIVDYKTSKSHARWARDVALHKYRRQLYFYKLLVEGSHSFAGYKATNAYLDFVEPDESGAIQKLQLIFDPAEEARTKQLAQIIWHRIKTLDLPNTSNYTPDLAGIEQFEADLLAQK